MSLFNPVNKQILDQVKALNAELKNTRAAVQAIGKESQNIVPDKVVDNSKKLKTNMHDLSVGNVILLQQGQALLNFTKQYSRDALALGGTFWQGTQKIQMQSYGKSSAQIGKIVRQMGQNTYNIASPDELNTALSENIKIMGKWRKDQGENMKIAQQIQKMTFGQVSLMDAGKLVMSMSTTLNLSSSRIRADLAAALVEGRRFGMGPVDVAAIANNRSFSSTYLGINLQQATRLGRIQNAAAGQGANLDQNQLISSLYTDTGLVSKFGINRGKFQSPNPEQALKGLADKFASAGVEIRPSAISPIPDLPPNVQDWLYFYNLEKKNIGKPLEKQPQGYWDKAWNKTLAESKTPLTSFANVQQAKDLRQAYGSWMTLDKEAQGAMAIEYAMESRDFLKTISDWYNKYGTAFGALVAPGVVIAEGGYAAAKAFPAVKSAWNWGKGLFSRAPAVAEGLEASMNSAALAPLTLLGLGWNAPGMKRLRSKDFMEQMLYGKKKGTSDTGDGPGDSYGFNIADSLSLRAKPFINRDTVSTPEASQYPGLPVDTGSLAKWGLLPRVAQDALGILSKWTDAYVASGYRSVDTVPGPGVSLHTKHRAFDISGPKVGRRGGYEMLNPILGQAIANYGVSLPDAQEVIFNRRIWSPRKGWHTYTGANPHYDHVHMGFDARIGNVSSGISSENSALSFSGRSTVFGTTGDHLLGHKTASGLVLGPNTLGAAIPMDMGKRSPFTMGSGVPYFPLKGGKTSVTVNYKGKELTIPVIDIGPATWTGNAIDLTAAATRALGFKPGDNPNVSYRINPPAMAEGGIINKPTLVMAGEAGREAIVPLDKGGAIGGIHLHAPVYFKVTVADGSLNSANQLMGHMETLLNKEYESLRDY